MRIEISKQVKVNDCSYLTWVAEAQSQIVNIIGLIASEPIKAKLEIHCDITDDYMVKQKCFNGHYYGMCTHKASDGILQLISKVEVDSLQQNDLDSMILLADIYQNIDIQLYQMAENGVEVKTNELNQAFVDEVGVNTVGYFKLNVLESIIKKIESER